MERLKTKINELMLDTPILGASGTFGYSNEYEFQYGVKNIGAVVTKAISLMPRSGNEDQRLFETYGGMINRIGLENMGIEAFFENILPNLKSYQKPFILNLAGSTKEEYLKLAKHCETEQIENIELNLSCPNVKEGCLEFGTDEKVLYELVSEVRQIFSKNLIVKLTPNVTEIEKIAIAAENAGADCVSAINTVKGLGVKLNCINGMFIKNEVQGGLSGRAIKPIALSMIKRIKNVIKLPIIGMGGIYCLSDIFEFVSVGADAVQIGTANFTYPNITQDLAVELLKFIQDNGFKDFNELKEKLRTV